MLYGKYIGKIEDDDLNPGDIVPIVKIEFPNNKTAYSYISYIKNKKLHCFCKKGSEYVINKYWEFSVKKGI